MKKSGVKKTVARTVKSTSQDKIPVRVHSSNSFNLRGISFLDEI